MPNVKILTRFDSDEAYIAAMRDSLTSEPENVRIGYAQLVEELAELLKTERLLREKVLLGDDPSTSSRLRGVLLLYNRIGLEAVEVHSPPTCVVEPHSLSGAHDTGGAVSTPRASSLPDLYFAILASYKFWVVDSHERFVMEACEAYEVSADSVRYALGHVITPMLKDLDYRVQRLHDGDLSPLERDLSIGNIYRGLVL